MRNHLAIILAAAAVSCGRGAPKPADKPGEKAATSTLNDMVGEFAQLPDQDLSSEATHYPAYIKGKMMFVYSLEPGVFLQHVQRGDGHPGLRDLWARSPEEVSTVLVVDCSRLEPAGDFVLTGSEKTLPGYDRVCVESVVDRTIPAVIFRRTVRCPAFRERSVPKGADRVVAQYFPNSSLGQIADKIVERRIELRD